MSEAFQERNRVAGLALSQFANHDYNLAERRIVNRYGEIRKLKSKRKVERVKRKYLLKNTSRKWRGL